MPRSVKYPGKINASAVILKTVFKLLILAISSAAGFSQAPGINLKEIPQKKVRKFIQANVISKIQDFSAIRTSWNERASESGFHFNEKRFYFHNKVSNVWDKYRNADLGASLNRKAVRFSMLLTKHLNTVTYPRNDIRPTIDTGQVYFLDLRLIKGLFNIPVSFEITSIDNTNQIIEFSYMEFNKTHGKQTLQFFDKGSKGTMIVHRSYFKSDSPIRDNLLYPPFHRKFIKTFHRNMKNTIKA